MHIILFPYSFSRAPFNSDLLHLQNEKFTNRREGSLVSRYEFLRVKSTRLIFAFALSMRSVIRVLLSLAGKKRNLAEKFCTLDIRGSLNFSVGDQTG